MKTKFYKRFWTGTLLWTGLFFASSVTAQQKLLDSAAINLLDKMSSSIGKLHSCTFTVRSLSDGDDSDFGTLSEFKNSKVSFSGNNKMQITTEAEDGKHGLWFNGKNLTYYSYTQNNFGTIDSVPPTTIEMIDRIHQKYGIDFPASDFFYPTFTDDLIDMCDHIALLGKMEIEGKTYYKIAGKGKNASFQVWLNSDNNYLPAKLIIIGLGSNERHYEATITDWKLDPELPDSMFVFQKPANANKLLIMAKK